MPLMDGIEATRKIRESGNKTPIIALTANSCKEDRDECLEAGMNKFLMKPVPLDKIRAVIEEIMGWQSEEKSDLSSFLSPKAA